MRRIGLLSLALLAGCATTAPQAAPAAAPPAAAAAEAAEPSSVCRQGDYSQFAGRTRSAEVEAELKRASGARVIRWVEPGMMVTMDYREDRMTVRLDEANRILSASCG